MSQKSKYIYIDTQEEFDGVIAGLMGTPLLAVDTEFVGEKSFYPRLELIQLGANGTIWLVDAMAVKNLSPLGTLLSSPDTMKLFHAADCDLRILKRATGAEPSPFFDTQVAASLLGYGAQISLTNLVRELLDVRLSGKQTTSDWGQRPLTADQLAYAASDVEHLAEIYRRLEAELIQKKRRHWYEDEQAGRLRRAMVDDDPADDPNVYRRIKNWSSLSPRELAILRELALWREQTARSRDTPRRSLLSDEGMVELARFQPANKDAAKRLRAVNVGQIMRSFDEISAVIARGQKVPKDQWPDKPAPERPDIPTGLQELCTAVLRMEADRLRVAPNVFATTSEIQSIINHRDDLDEDSVPILTGWRREAVGETILKLIRGKIAVGVDPTGNLMLVDR